MNVTAKEGAYQNLMIFHPGAYLEEILEKLPTTQAEFAERSQISPKVVGKIISGEDDVPAVVARKLVNVTGISAQTWLNLQKNYDEAVVESKHDQFGN